MSIFRTSSLRPLLVSSSSSSSSNIIVSNPVCFRLFTRRWVSNLGRSDGRFITYRPMTGALRHRRDIDMNVLGVYQGDPIPSLTIRKIRSSGRNHHGRITVRGRGGGPKRVIRTVDFIRRTPGPQSVVRIEYDPFRSAFLALLKHQSTHTLSYIVAPQGIKTGDIVQSYRTGVPPELTTAQPGTVTPIIQIGNCLKIKDIPVGTTIHCIGLRRWGPAQLCRAAGTNAQIISNGQEGYAKVRLQSGEVRLIHVECVATIGSVSNPDWMHRILGSAGANRNRGRRPKVRGVAMNPCDHPHGGGEGKTKGKIPVTPWGIPTKGYRTRQKNKPTWWIVKGRPRGKDA